VFRKRLIGKGLNESGPRFSETQSRNLPDVNEE